MAGEPGYSAASISVERKTGHDLILDTSSTVPSASYSVAPSLSEITHMYAWVPTFSSSSDIAIWKNSSIYLDTYPAIYTIDEQPTEASALFLPDGTQIFPDYFWDVDDYDPRYLKIIDSTHFGFTGEWSGTISQSSIGSDGTFVRDSTKDLDLPTVNVGPKLYAWTTSNTSSAEAYGIPTTIYTLTPNPQTSDFVTNHNGHYITDANGNMITWDIYLAPADGGISAVSSDSITWYSSAPA